MDYTTNHNWLVAGSLELSLTIVHRQVEGTKVSEQQLDVLVPMLVEVANVR